MKNILKYSVLLAFITVTLNSCFDEYLDPVPGTQISDLSAFQTKERIVAQVNGMYAAYRNGNYLGGRYQVYNEIRGENFLNRQANGVTGLNTWNHNLAASTNEVQNLWGQVYTAINTVNVFIEGLEASNPVSKGILTQAEFDQFKGEGLALRGMAHFHLAMLYAWPYNYNPQAPGIIVRLKAQKSSADNNQARETLTKTYQDILTDLNDAETLLPTVTAGTANAAGYVTRIHKNSVIALKTRVYMHMNNWPSVITEGNKIVPNAAPFNATAGVSNGLAGTFASIFASSYVTSESVLSMPMTATELPGTQNGMAHYFSASTVGNNEYSINPTSAVWTNIEFPADDARRLLTAVSGADLYVNKFQTFPHSDWVPVIRWAEVILNVAEAEAMSLGVTQRAVDILNAVYLRSNPTATPYVIGDFANGAALAARILRERNMEFLGEGLNNMDTMRKLATFGGKTGPGGVVPPVAINEIKYVWPIPQTELNTNGLVEQNNTVPTP
jgi:starch-binding outer membrane protein, SusD/RagB family